jgi:putative transposase
VPVGTIGATEPRKCGWSTKDQVSRLCGGLDEQVTAFRERPLEGAYPYLWLDAKVEKVRAGGRVEHHALVVAYSVDATGQREVIGLDVARPRPRRSGGSSCAAWSAGAWPGAAGDLRRPPGPQASDRPGAELSWQRCTVHVLRDALGHCPKDLQQLVGAAIRPIFRANSLAEARQLLGETVTHLEARVPKVARLLWSRARPAGLLRLPGRPPLQAAQHG